MFFWFSVPTHSKILQKHLFGFSIQNTVYIFLEHGLYVEHQNIYHQKQSKGKGMIVYVIGGHLAS